MAFLKENVVVFIKDHLDDLPSEAIGHAEQEISQWASRVTLEESEAYRVFGSRSAAQWFLSEMGNSRKHREIFVSTTSKLSQFEACRKCGGVVEQSENNISYEVYRCEQCGHEEVASC